MMDNLIKVGDKVRVVKGATWLAYLHGCTYWYEEMRKLEEITDIVAEINPLTGSVYLLNSGYCVGHYTVRKVNS